MYIEMGKKCITLNCTLVCGEIEREIKRFPKIIHYKKRANMKPSIFK